MLGLTVLLQVTAQAGPPGRLVGVAVGSAAVCVLRFLCSFLSGVLIWGNLSDGLPAWIYSLTYNGSYMLPDILICLVIFALLYKPLKKYFTAADLQG